MSLLEAKSLTKSYRVPDAQKQIGSRRLVAVQEVSFSLEEGQTLGIVGESGSGKSTLARLLLRLEKPDSGELLFESKSILKLNGSRLKAFRRQVQIVFQDPLASLNPKMRVLEVLREPFDIHSEVSIPDKNARVGSLLRDVGLSESLKDRYPHELSGGERQRVSIARAIALEPKVVICDEAVSSLDVLVQAEILNLLLRLQQNKGLSYVFISHDLSVVRHMSDQLLVMKDGCVVESGSAQDIYTSPKAPYTRELLF